MNLVDLAVAVLATNSMVELLRHDGRLYGLRIKWRTTPFFWSRVLRCGFCSSYWAAALAVGLATGPRLLFPQYRVTLVPYLPVLVLAVARAAQLLSDLTHERSRSPKRPEPDDEEVTTHGQAQTPQQAD